MLHISYHGLSWSTPIIVMPISHTQHESCQNNNNNKLKLYMLMQRKEKEESIHFSPVWMWAHLPYDVADELNNIIGFVNAFIINIILWSPYGWDSLMNLTSKNNGPLLNELKLGLGNMAHSCHSKPCSCLYSKGWAPYYLNNVMRIKI